MKKIIIFLFLFLIACGGFKEKNPLAIPPVAKDELKVSK